MNQTWILLLGYIQCSWERIVILSLDFYLLVQSKCIKLSEGGILVRETRVSVFPSSPCLVADSLLFFRCVVVEASCHNGDETIETIEAAEALLNMDSPGPMLDEKRISECFCVPIVLVYIL